ncbi:MAG: pentapeptide repeat-containing protein, partial [Arcobacteraceae bacterium]|nr:pentapeptide repeat-containing protein [Arcobacteraceae bacterium]
IIGNYDMNDVVKYNKFLDSDINIVESKSYQFYIFKDLIIRQSRNFKFFRCDFRGAKFSDNIFENVNFERSDFIDSYVDNTSFSNCTFGPTGIHNSYFYEVKFNKNKHSSTFISNTIFKKCKFDDEFLTKSELRNCEFIDCEFNNIKINMSTYDVNIFKNCKLTNFDMSNMYAMNLKFDNTEFNNTIIDLDYIGSYLFINCNFSKLKYKYKNEVIKINTLESLMKSLITNFLDNNRCVEAFNLLILYRFLTKNDIEIKSILNQVFNKDILNNQKKLFLSLNSIIDLLEFYFNTSNIYTTEYILLVPYITYIANQYLDKKESFIISSKLSLFNYLIENIEYDYKFIQNDNSQTKLTFKLDKKDQDMFITNLDSIFNYFNQESINNIDFKSYEIISIRKACIIIELITYTAYALSLFKALEISAKITKNILLVTLNTSIAWKVYKKQINLLENTINVQELKKVTKFKLSDTFTIKDIDSELESMSKIVKNLDIDFNSL